MATFVVPAIAGAAISGAIASDTAAKQRKAQEESARVQISAAEKARESLGKATDQAITDIEASELEARGLITESERLAIEGLNASTEGFIGALEKLKEESKSQEQIILEDIGRSGILTREELEQGVLADIAQQAGFTEQAIAQFSPFTEAGIRALRQIQFETGLLTPEESEAFIQEFGPQPDREIGEVDVSATRRAAEEALERRQRALGIRQSGRGIEEFTQLGADIEKEEFRRGQELRAEQQRERELRLGRLEGIAGRGQQAAGDIAGLTERASARALELRSRLRENIARQRQNELAQRTLQRQFFGGQRFGLGQQQAQQQFTTGQQIANIRQQTPLTLADLITQGATTRGNLRIGQAAQAGQLGLQQAQIAARREQQLGNLAAQQSLAPLQGALAGLSLFGQFQGMNRANQQQGFGGGFLA